MSQNRVRSHKPAIADSKDLTQLREKAFLTSPAGYLQDDHQYAILFYKRNFRQVGHFVKKILIAVVVCLLLNVVVRADWIDAYTSPEAGIDSIERFLVITDLRDSTFFGRCITPAGDVDRDGLQDVMICRPWWSDIDTSGMCYLFYGGEPVDSGFQRGLKADPFEIENLGDVNGDRYDDFGVLAFPPIRFDVYMGGTDMDSFPSFSFSIYSHIPPSADLDADGNKELPLSSDLNGGFVHIYDIETNRDSIPEYTIPDTAVGFGRRLAVGDVI